MTWVTWHQHRREALISLVFLAAIAIVLVYSGLQMRAFATTINLSVCTGTGAGTSTCGIAMQQFLSAFAPIGIFILQMLAVVPGLVGVFIGAPLLARELEQGTHLLAWTQTITRTRWLVIKLALVGAATMVAGLAAAQLASWWWAPLAVGFSSGDWQAFEAIGVSPAAYGIFALGFGVAAGAIIRRTVPAMLITTLGFAAARLAVAHWLRPFYMPPMTGSMDPGSAGADDRGRLFIELLWADASGHRVANDAVNKLVAEASDPSTVLAQHGLHQLMLFQPASRFVTFQLMEAAMFAGCGLALLALAVWRAKRL
jgi:hypothetical protein